SSPARAWGKWGRDRPRRPGGPPGWGSSGNGGTARGPRGPRPAPPPRAPAGLGKFRKGWSCEVIQKLETGAPRPTFAWKLTPAGMSVEPRDGIKVKFEKIVKAAQFLRDQKGKKVEPEAWRAFLKTLDEVQAKEEEKKQ